MTSDVINNLWDAGSLGGIFARDALNLLADEHVLDAFRPVEHGVGPVFVQKALLAPLSLAIPGFEVRADIAVSGSFWVPTGQRRAGISSGDS